MAVTSFKTSSWPMPTVSGTSLGDYDRQPK